MAAERFAPMLTDGGWSGGDAQIAATRDENNGELVFETSHPVDSIDQLEDLLSLPRPISQIAPDESTLAALPDLPAEAPLQASSGGGSSSTLVNGLILAVLAGIVMLVFALRGLRRRRGRREPT